MSLKRTAASAGLDVEPMLQSPNKRARFTTIEELMFNGMLPLMSLPTCMKKAPDMQLVRSVKQILLTGVKSQKQVARECGLSQTKMSQFMNCAGRNKGWEVVERTVADWLANFKRHNNNSIDLQSDLACKVSPITSLYSNMNQVSVTNVYNPSSQFYSQPKILSHPQLSVSSAQSASVSEHTQETYEIACSQYSSSTSITAEPQVAGNAADTFSNFEIWGEGSCYDWEVMNSPESWSDNSYSQVLETTA